jgi:hypothetical protein
LFHPASAFDALRIVLEELAIFARRPDLNAMRERVGGRAASAIGVLEELGAFQEWGQAPEHAPTPRLLLRRLLGWFDGLKTLRFLNGIRARQGGGQTRKEALREASFVPDEVSDLPLGQQLRWFRSRRPPEQTSVLLSLERFLQGST